MALIAGVLGLNDAVGNSGTQTTGGSTAAIPLLVNEQIAINANQDINIRFSNTNATGVTAAVAADFRIPQNSTFVFHIPKSVNEMFLYNGSGSTATYWWTYLNKF
jgi:hypothetical protein